MRCLHLIGLSITSIAFASPVNAGGTISATKWSELSKLNEPANKPSLLAAKAATQGMTRKQIKDKHFRLKLLLKEATPYVNGTAIQILKREVAMLEMVGGN